jgi:hypothetical protein
MINEVLGNETTTVQWETFKQPCGCTSSAAL